MKTHLPESEIISIYERMEILANSGIWKLDVKNQKLMWSVGMYEIYEIDRSVKDIYLSNLIDKKIHPSDVELINEQLSHSIKTGEDYIITHRIIFDDGRVKYIKGHAECEKNENGEVIFLIGTAHDYTQEQELLNVITDEKNIMERKYVNLKYHTTIDTVRDSISKLRGMCD